MSFFNTLIASASALTIAACATVGPDYVTPDTDDLTTSMIQTDAAATTVAVEPAQVWWTALGDDTLNALVDQAFSENRDLRQAVANLEAARAALGLERTNLRPQGQAGASYERRRLAGAAFGLDDASFDDSNFYSIGGAASWELDFFGRVRRGVEAAYAETGAAEALRRDAQALVAAETVRAYTDYRGAEVQLDVARQNLEVQNSTLELTQTRLEEGLGQRLDVARAEAQVKTTEASIPPLEAAKVAAATRLATLTGSTLPGIEDRLAQGTQTLPVPPASLAIGDVETLIDRRADIRLAERQLAAATARIGLAKADYFPRIALTGSIDTSAQSLAGVGNEGSFGYGVGPSLTWVGFDVPRVRAQVKAAGARAESSYAAYEQTVLVALEETQTALTAYGREKVRFDALATAAERAREAAELARIRYDGGVDDFIDVLDAESRQLSAEAALAVSRTAVTRNYADVYRALGAGWTEAPQA
ncbi:MAG: efflux transporter outer membrane subunit [Pseudomonadota bacterium]